MNETAKTIVFVAVAVVVLAVLVTFQWMSRSWLPVLEPEEMVEKPLFEDFEPLAVVDMEIIKYDEDTGQANSFRVAQVKNRWSIPSHADYPADAKDQLADAAESVMGRQVLSVESDNPADHGLYGVIDPGAKTLKPGSVGVGTRVTMKNKKDEKLLDMVIGKEVKGQSDLRYVRRAGQDPVYTMKVSTDKLSTKFEEWIEDDLLKLNTWDLRQVEIHDHSVDEAQGAVIQRGEMVLAYDDAGDPKWKMAKDKRFEQGQWVDSDPLADDEELDTSKLDDLKNALDDLKIVDVRRKPAGLSGELKAEKEFDPDDEAFLSLRSKGFYLASMGGRTVLVSNEGDIRCLMKDGVEYVLRFGNVTDTAAGTAAEEGGADSSDLNRYIFVMAQFNQKGIPEPKLEPLPEEEKQPDETKTTEGQATKTEKPEEESTEGEKPEGEKAEGNQTDGEAPEEKAEENKAGDDQATEDKATEDKATEDKATEDKATEDKADEKKDIEAERERIKKENKRKQDEYDEKVEKGKERVKELNNRFADWYYVISDNVYKQIHLGRDQIVKKKEKKEDETAKEGTNLEQPRADEGSGVPDQPAQEPTGPASEFNRLKQEGPDGEE